VGVTLVASSVYNAVQHVVREHEELVKPALTRSGALETQAMDSSWVTEGRGDYKIHTFATSTDGNEQSGIWECTGPAKFTWHFASDETVYILDGQVHIDYDDGHKRTLTPGSVAFFPAGSKASWHIPHSVKKSFHLSHPSRLKRIIRSALYSYQE
jgi:uncharacterized cupin superfamily protein